MTSYQDFLFIGYLIQEPYWRNWPGREGFRVASIERAIHPNYDKYQWNSVAGTLNSTKFLTEFPNLEKLSLAPQASHSVRHQEDPGWVVCGYGIPSEIAATFSLASADGKQDLKVFEYASLIQRHADGLGALGFEVVDAEVGFPFLSILNNCGFSVDQVREMAGSLNSYSLFDSPEVAERFIQAIKTDRKNPGTIPSHSKGISVQVWGKS